MVLYGQPGIGKTSFGAAIPGVVFLIDDQEDGINTLKNSGIANSSTPVLPPARSWHDVLGILQALKERKHDYKALVIDSMGGMERLCHDYVCRRDFKNDWGEKGFIGYQRGYETSLVDWRNFLNGLDGLRSDRGMRIICLAHSLVHTFKNPAGEDYDRYVPDMNRKTWSITHKWADAVVFANYYVVVDKSKGRGGTSRVMHTEYTPAFEAKNRHNLPEEIDMGNTGVEAWTNFCNAMQAGKAG